VPTAKRGKSRLFAEGERIRRLTSVFAVLPGVNATTGTDKPLNLPSSRGRAAGRSSIGVVVRVCWSMKNWPAPSAQRALRPSCIGGA
jgi:hypothetical protein